MITKTLKDIFVFLITVGAFYIFLMPIETLHGDNIISNLVVPIIILLCLATYIFMFYDFAVKKRVERKRGLWFFCFLIFNYIAAVAYYIFFYRRNISNNDMLGK